MSDTQTNDKRPVSDVAGWMASSTHTLDNPALDVRGPIALNPQALESLRSLVGLLVKEELEKITKILGQPECPAT